MIKPFLPAVTDWYEHEFNPIQHEIKVHMVYGNHHLEKDMAENTSEKSHNNGGSVKSQDPVPFHVLEQQFESFNISISSDTQYQLFHYNKLLCVFISREGPPPKLRC
ncbi:hypothetical protein [Segetibacter aerophilus]|uniref:Uncharacterized protein n=1 Tax=Segetibacter aerophilus TaxID=670293 RepID=A0A512BFS3_9BACT|nr:hypothetical protein [Segetibacter aerophilus]GEO10818.1 hypothetical protein SAE01_33140 [Segetibacter aerophilus]